MIGESKTVNILVVEDSPTQAHQLKLILGSAGFKVDVVFDGNSALQKFEDKEYDAVLSDVVMPGLSGYELCRKIKGNDRGRDVPVVLLTALNDLGDLIEGLRHGADNFLSKPFEPSFLVARLNNILSAKKGAPTSSVCDPDSGVCRVDQKFVMTLDRKRMLDYLIATFDDFLCMRRKQIARKAAFLSEHEEKVERSEQSIDSILYGLHSYLLDSKTALNALLSEDYGALNPRQTNVVLEAKKAIEFGLKSLADVLENNPQGPGPIFSAKEEFGIAGKSEVKRCS